MLILKIFPSAVGLKSPSPFSMKAIALMEMSGLAYKTKSADSRKTAKKKLPVLIDQEKEIPDSTHIQAHLENAHKIDFDKGLSEEQLAIGEAFRRLNEEHLYWVLVYSRWVENSDIVRDHFFGSIPSLIRKFVFAMVLKQVKEALFGHGMGRHTRDEIYQFGAADLKAISEYLGDKDYFFGDTPTSIDASLSAMITNIVMPPLESPLKQAALSHDNLVAYHERCMKKFNTAQAK